MVNRIQNSNTLNDYSEFFTDGNTHATPYDKFPLTHYDNLTKEHDTILSIGCYDLSLLYSIYKHNNKNCSIIGYSDNIEVLYKTRTYFRGIQEITFFGRNFIHNDLKNNSVDLILGNNILGEDKKNIFREIDRVLTSNGKFVFKELISTAKPHKGFHEYFKKKDNHIFNYIIFNIQHKLKFLKNCKYEIKIIGNGNFYFHTNDITSLQEYCDLYGYRMQTRKKILSEIFLVIIKGNK